VVNGARSWLGIGGIGIQPAEFTKVATVLMLARYLESAEFDSSFKKLLITGIIMIIPLALILAQPDFGSALVFVPAALVMLTLADVDFRYILFGVLSIFGVFLFLSLPLYASNHPNPEISSTLRSLMKCTDCYTYLCACDFDHFRNRMA